MSWYEENQAAWKEEFDKCKNDPVYFYENYVVKANPETGKFEKPTPCEVNRLRNVLNLNEKTVQNGYPPNTKFVKDEAFIPGMTAEGYKQLWQCSMPKIKGPIVGLKMYTGTKKK